MSWDDFRWFLTIVRAGSIRGAARDLNVHHSAVSRRLAQFEHQIGATLFHRRHRGMVPTAAGEEVARAAHEMDHHVHATSRRIADHLATPAGWVRVSVNVNVGHAALMPLFARFSALHPGIDLDVRMSQTVADLATNEADVAIRVGVTPPDDAISMRLCGFAIAEYASCHTPTHWLGWDPHGPYDGFIRESGRADLPLRHRFADELLLLQAIKLGMGAALLPCMLGDPDPALLRRSAPRIVASTFLLRHPDHRKTPHIRALVDFLAGAFADAAERLEGRRGSDEASEVCEGP